MKEQKQIQRLPGIWGAVLGTVLAVVGISVPIWVHASEETFSEAKTNLSKFFPGMTIRDLQAAPLPGLIMFSVNQDEQVFYSDMQGRYVIAGAALFDLQSQRNLTQDHLMVKRRELLDAVPLQHAIILTPEHPLPNGPKRPLLIFDDPDCPYCRELHKELKQLTAAGVPVAIFLYPVERLHPGVTQKSVNVWCAANRIEALENAIAGKAVPLAAAPCEHPIEENIALAKRLGAKGTPYIVLPDGRAVSGLKPANELLAMLGLPPTVAQQIVPQ
jgi:thiol:disulfide interchange protein DsbC